MEPICHPKTLSRGTLSRIQNQNPLYDELNEKFQDNEFLEHKGREGYGVPRNRLRP